jgi:uncharacterized repeat protein (TIGR01451 family)
MRFPRQVLAAVFVAAPALGRAQTADLAITQSDAPDPVAPDNLVTYTITVTNLGPSTSPGMTVTDALPVTFSFASAGCTHVLNAVTCTFGSLAPGATATATIRGRVPPLATTGFSNTAVVSGLVMDPVPANNSHTEPTGLLLERSEAELVHGTDIRADLAGEGGQPDVDVYRISMKPLSSYEVVVDETSGDIGAGSGPILDRLLTDGTTLIQSSEPVGVGSSRRMRFVNSTAATVNNHLVRVRSGSCGSDCGTKDTYRLRVWDASAAIPRFNNTGGQTSVLILQNRTSEPLTFRPYFWNDAGAELYSHVFVDIPPKGSWVFITTDPLELRGKSGSITIVHWGGYDALAGKCVSVEPSTGFAFDSLLVSKPR